MTILDQLCLAIRSKSVVEVVYDGERRVVRPHVVWTDKKSDTMVECWQTAGYSSRGKIPCWSRYNLEKITGLEVSDEHFPGPQQDFNPERPGDIICSL